MQGFELAYDYFDPEAELLREALTSTGNGYFCTRGTAEWEDPGPSHYPGTYAHGGYNRETTIFDGRPVLNEDLVNLPNWLVLKLRIEDGPAVGFDEIDLLDYKHVYDIRLAMVRREMRFLDRAGRETTLRSRRFVSMAHSHQAGIEWTIVPENWSGRVEIVTALDGRMTNHIVARYRELEGRHLDPVSPRTFGPETIALEVQTRQSHLYIAEAARTRVFPGGDRRPADVERSLHQMQDYIQQILAFDVEQGRPVRVEKMVSLFTSHDNAITEPLAAAGRHVLRYPDFAEALAEHEAAWTELWDGCDVRLPREERAQLLLRLHIAHVLQVCSRHTARHDAGVPARGLNGEAYRGHVFWDELFILPFLAMRFPEIARALLMYRWRRLPEARWAARRAGLRGACYPWQSGSDGTEQTQRLHLNPRSGRWLPDHTHLQRHVGLAIAYNVWRFHEATGDTEFLAEYGAEMLLEIARYFADLAVYNRVEDRYEIRGVMGPDEYHDAYPDRDEPGLDNNAYTNVMTAWVLRRALEVLALLPPEREAELREDLMLTRGELEHFEEVARKLKVPFHDGVISQFEGYGELEELDWEGYRARYGDIRRLDRILEAEGDTVNRYKASKQPDVLMLCYLLSPGELGSVLTGLGVDSGPDLIPRTIRYYLPRTCDGSSLSAVVHAWILARTGDADSWRFFQEALHSDIADIQGGTTAEGIHLGAMAGTVDLVQRCYAGISTCGDTLCIDPRPPKEITALRLGLRYRGHWGIDLACDHERLRVRVRPSAASPIRVAHAGRSAVIDPGGCWEVPL